MGLIRRAADLQHTAESGATLGCLAANSPEPGEQPRGAEPKLRFAALLTPRQRRADGQTTLVFEDRLDPKDGPPIVRRLTITAPSKHGLPAAMGGEVIVGLIQLTKRRNNFTDPKVSFFLEDSKMPFRKPRSSST